MIAGGVDERAPAASDAAAAADPADLTDSESVCRWRRGRGAAARPEDWAPFRVALWSLALSVMLAVLPA